MKKTTFLTLFLIFTCLFMSAQEINKVCKVRSKCSLRPEPNPNYELTKIKKGQTVTVIDIVKDYYLVDCNGQAGYVNNLFIYDPELIEIAKQREDAKKKTEQVNTDRIKAERKQGLIDEYGEYTALLIERGRVILGMSEKAVRAALGSPSDINRTKGSWGVHEQWVYRDKAYKYLYFENGILKTIQN